ncbi:MAG: hypothetical protein JWM06_3303 [Actinomycetia bacterium]|nr:hypothetical protein [Actinomycetes bacterium]
MSALPSTQTLRERVDTAQVLTRFHFVSRAIALACGGWIAATPRLDSKAALARAAWQQTLAGDAFRERVFELRYPNRFLEEGADAPLIRVVEAGIDAPDADQFLEGLTDALLPDYAQRLGAFLAQTDELDDGPTVRIVRQALADVEEQIAALDPGDRPGSDPDTWVSRLRHGLETLEPPAGTPFRLAEQPARDDAYLSSSFYWPDAIVPGYPYGEGVALQVRSAVSHLNEVWAVDTAGAILHGLAPELGWEWIRDAGRWTYDEARHMLMGKRRLDAWGLPTGQIPLGGYIYEACAGQDPLYRLGMLGYFETKNIGRKRERAAAFHAMGDTTSETDMEFDWADETLHAEYGRRWLKDLLERRGDDPESWPAVLERCEQLVAARVAKATDDERARIVAAADALVAEASARAA